ncbi:HK97 family phage prohead protease [Peribacillus butanolivorans]|uniref:HK97 family phage prohead protease n=1 Tax=Peribacillus butanolivorans TaxID=421767 RepID=A0ABM6XMJ5_9BACI|nr:HK97 family phage prohead protease [Peribacillus butanolivorans]AXN39621.1 HK97 family phage prohead protease [Peribacillus butanolivorans]
MKMELRVQDSELCANSDGSLTVSGYVNKTGQLSEILGVTKRFKEKIARGAFSRAIQSAKRDVDFLAEHKGDLILASTRNGSLQLNEDEQGLFMSAKVTPTSWGKDYYELINSGILRNMSFGFRTIKDSWKQIESNLYERTIEELELFEVSVVKNPAYSQSTIAARGIDLVEDVEIPVEPEVEEVEVQKEKDLDLHIQKTQIEVEKQKASVSSAERMLKLNDSNSSRSYLERTKKVLEEKRNELSKLQEEQKMIEELKKEIRELQDVGTGQSSISQQVAPITELLESTSDVVAKSRKIKLVGQELKLPYETELSDAEFVLDGDPIPEVSLNLAEVTKLSPKRIGIAQRFSNVLLNEVGVLEEHSKSKLVSRVGKKIEEEILVGDGTLTGLHGIAPDELVPSVNIAIAPTELLLRALYLKVNSEYRPFCKWYMSEQYFEKVAKIIVNGEYIVKSKTVDNKVVATLWEHEIEVTNAIAAGDTIGQVPIIFADIANAYTLAISKDVVVTKLGKDSIVSVSGNTLFMAEMYCDGSVHNYQAVAKGTISA